MKKIWKVISIGDCLKNRSTILFTNRRLKSNHDFSRHMCVLQACWMYLLWVMIGSLDYLHLLWLATSRFSLYPVLSPLLYSASNARRRRHNNSFVSKFVSLHLYSHRVSLSKLWDINQWKYEPNDIVESAFDSSYQNNRGIIWQRGSGPNGICN